MLRLIAGEIQILLDIDDGINSKTGNALFQPPVDHGVKLLQHLGIFPVQVRLFLCKGMKVVKILKARNMDYLKPDDFGFTDEALAEPQYNWGYDPVNFNVPEGSYATDPYHGAVRVAEMKQMVKALHDNGLSVIMDVVYNHVYHDQPFCFNQIVPAYFSRVNADGVWSSGSICGNDTASERSMVRKYIVDSVNYWADEYHIDGFRFDLVGLIDVQTINEIVATVREKHPNVIFYGEGWDMPTELTKPGIELAIQPNSHKMPGFAFFSDTLRDLMRGRIQEHTAKGFVAGTETARVDLDASFMGMPDWAAQPCQCINYVSCHDNHTLYKIDGRLGHSICIQNAVVYQKRDWLLPVSFLVI